jgi:hypothetical protein
VAPVIERLERRFQIWAYSVGMARLLLRSTKSDTFATRVDVLFQNVTFLKLPTSLDGLVVTEADSEGTAQISSETGILPGDGVRIFAIRSGAFDGYVIAGVCVVAEDKGEYFEPSQLWPEL